MAEPQPLARVGIVGGGTVALLAAIAVARALPTSDVFLLPCPVPEAALADHAVAGGAALHALHARIGIGERLLLARAGASHCLATRVEGLGGRAACRIGHGAAVRDAAGGFVAEPSLAALLAEAERFIAPGQAGGELLDPVLRVDPEAYRTGLAMLARQARVAQLAPALGWAGQGQVALADGTRFEADLLIDATGSGWVRDGSGSGGGAWIDADGPDRCCRLTAGPRLSLIDTLREQGGGVLLEQPGRAATHWTACWRSGEDAQAVLDGLATASGGTPGAAFAIASGRREHAWHGRIVAIGDAAARFAPSASLNLHLAAAQILLLLDLLPSGAAPFAEAGEYNRRTALLADHALDVAAALQGGGGSALLAQRSDQFARRGWVPELAEGLVSVDFWAQLLAGLGHGPGRLPRRAAMPDAAVAAAAEARQRAHAALLADAQPYARWLDSQA